MMDKEELKAVIKEVVKELLVELERSKHTEGSPLISSTVASKSTERSLSKDLEAKLLELADFIIKHKERLGF